MSLRPVTSCSPVACSGLKYCVMPSDIPISRIRSLPACEIAGAIPHSATSTRPSLVRRMLSGLRSRCATLCVWA